MIGSAGQYRCGCTAHRPEQKEKGGKVTGIDPRSLGPAAQAQIAIALMHQKRPGPPGVQKGHQSEDEAQMEVLQWAALRSATEPKLEMLYHVPNEGKRSPTAGARLKKMGLKPGIPDLILDCPAGRYHGCRIELKCGQNRPTENQLQWLIRMQAAGYFVAICWGAEAAIAQLAEYCGLPPGGTMQADCAATKSKYGIPALRPGRSDNKTG